MKYLDKAGLAFLWEKIVAMIPDWVGDSKPTYTALEVGAAVPSRAVGITLSAADWMDGRQTVAVQEGMAPHCNAIVGLAQAATSQQVTSAGNAKLMATAQDLGLLTVTAFGTVPTIDIPITIMMVG